MSAVSDTRRSGRGMVITAVVAVVVYLVLLWLSQQYASPQQVGSSYDSSPLGLKAYFAYLERLGYSPGTLERFDELPPPGDSTIIAAEPLVRMPTDRERRSLAEWVEQGGRLVVFGYGPSLLTDLDLSGNIVNGPRDPIEPVLPSPYIMGVEAVDLDGARLQVADPAWVAHLKDERGQGMLSRAVGAGEVVWLPSPYPASNGGILEESNARLVVALAVRGGRDIFFDEYHHGYVSGGGLWERLGHGGRAALLLALLAVASLALGPFRRLGRPIPAVEVPLARTGAYVSSLAELYKRVGAHKEALETLEDGLKRVLARRYGTLQAGLTRHPEARDALELSARTRATGLRGKDYVKAAEALSRARREVEGRDG
ncbi:MAG: hypothetical protein Kow0056_07410 [Coriobacteriia bacterium]